MLGVSGASDSVNVSNCVVLSYVRAVCFNLLTGKGVLSLLGCSRHSYVMQYSVNTGEAHEDSSFYLRRLITHTHLSLIDTAHTFYTECLRIPKLLGKDADAWHQLYNSKVAQTIKQDYSKVTAAQSSHSDPICYSMYSCTGNIQCTHLALACRFPVP